MRLGVSGKVLLSLTVLLVAFAGDATFTVLTLHRARQGVLANEAYLDLQGSVDAAWKSLNDFAPSLGRNLRLDPNLALAPQVRNHPTVPFHSDDNQVADWSNLDWQTDERFAMGAMRSDWAVTDSNTVTFLASYDRFRNDHSMMRLIIKLLAGGELCFRIN